MGYVNPGKLYVERFGEVTTSEDVLRYAHFLLEASGLDGTPPIDLAKIYKKFDIPNPKQAALKDQQGLLLNPERGIILIKEDDPAARQRFTAGHELMELLFAALSVGTGWAARQTGVFKLPTKERLCNEGSAELLMPRATFLPRLQQLGVSFASARQLATDFHVSMTAAAVHMVRVAPGRHALILWRMKNKPSEIRGKVSPNQLSLWGQTVTIPPKKLRIEWAFNGPNVPYIPTDKSAPDASFMSNAWLSNNSTIGEDVMSLGTTNGVFRSENRPFESQQGERMVLSLLHFPLDVGCPTTFES